MVGVDRADLGDLRRVVAVVGQLVVALGDADHPVLLLAPLAGEHAGGDAGHVGLERQHHQVAHQAEVLRQVGRDRLRLDRACGRLDRRQLVGAGDPQLQLADAGEILVQLLPVGAAQAAVQAPCIVQDGVEHAGPEPIPLEAVGVVGPLGEQTIEDQPGIDLGRQRRSGRAPGHGVLVDAGIAAVAVAGPAVPFDAELQRGEPGAIAEPAGGDLVGRDAGPEVGPGGLPRLAAGQERRRGAGVVAAAVAVGPGLVAGQAAQDEQVVLERSQRLKDRREARSRPPRSRASSRP